MKKYLLPENGNFYKANLHCHTTVSDGNLTPAEVKAAYKAQGYSVVAYTDHWVMLDHSDLDDESFLTLKGYEVIIGDTENISPDIPSKKTYHLNLIAESPDRAAQVCFNGEVMWGKEKACIPFISYLGGIWDYSEYSPEAANRIIAQARANGFLVNYNHPAWSLQTSEDYSALRGLTGVEVVNGVSLASGYPDDNSAVYAEMLREDKSLIPIAADDNHNEHPIDSDASDSFIGYNMIKAERLDYESVIKAIKNGDTYATMGPEIYELYVENEALHIKTSPVCRVILSTLGRHNTCINRRNGGAVTECTIPLPEEESYFRIELVDREGKRAFTPLYKNDGIY